MTRNEWIKAAQKHLEAGRSATPRLDAEVLLAHVLQVDRIQLHMYPDTPVAEEDSTRLEELVLRRKAGEPVAYLTGVQEFMGLTFHVTPAVLIPRPETEFLVESVLERLKDMRCRRPGETLLAADIGTGSGCIAVSLAVLFPPLQVLAADLSPEALAVARRNVAFHGVGDQVKTLQGNLLVPVREYLQQKDSQPFRTHRHSQADSVIPEGSNGGNGHHQDRDQKLDAIISNPPYIKKKEMRELPPSVAAYEPHQALAGGGDGLRYYREITAHAPALLRPGGLLAFEVGYRQGQAVSELMRLHGFVRTLVLPDLAGLDRVVLGSMP